MPAPAGNPKPTQSEGQGGAKAIYLWPLRAMQHQSRRTGRPLKEGRPQMTSARREMRGWEIAARVVGALLCAAVAYIHVKDQGGITGTKDPAYMQVGYYLIEVIGVATAVMLLTLRRSLTAWFLAMGVAAGPF